MSTSTTGGKNIHPSLYYLKDKISKNDLVLDLGCKNGKYMDKLSTKTVSVDISFTETSGETEYVYGDGFNLPFNSNSFDFVFCSQTLEHVPDTGTIVAEASRVLKRNGKCIFTFPNRLAPTKPHPLPRWYSYLPVPIGTRIAPYLLDDETVEFYRTSEFMMTTITAQKHLNRIFSDVEYLTFQTSDYDPSPHTLTKLAKRVDENIPIVRSLLRLFWPDVQYLCKDPNIAEESRPDARNNLLVKKQKDLRDNAPG
ncbi:class I SAM-dependent methyltransferase [Natrinema sp. H-ect4]|uniref:class I SAM-dependent methyltransferase n=1 Tax=Natrinema sp. H-ect4 TaxID=3242699 RepID=UPI0035A96D88